jgi:D-alanyl-D-alanine carboxypeptidase (penicillin-binding protein 5/6)
LPNLRGLADCPNLLGYKVFAFVPGVSSAGARYSGSGPFPPARRPWYNGTALTKDSGQRRIFPIFRHRLFAWASTFILASGAAPSSTPAPAPPPLSAQGAILVDGTTGQILYGKAIDQPFYPASITKIMTAYLAIRDGWNRTVHVSVAAQNQPGSSCYLRAGEVEPMSSVVTCMMLVSGNDAAWAVAQTVSGSVSRFVQLMNRTAQQWGATGVHFTNPSGLPDPHHVVTARGMAIIAEHAMQNPIFQQVVATKESTLPPDPRPRQYYNQNRLLYDYPGAVGIKIGYTVEADETIVAAARRNGVLLIAVLLHDTPAGLWPDARHLLSWGFANFHPVTIANRGQAEGTVELDGRSLAVRAGEALHYLAPRGATPVISVRRELTAAGSGAIRAGEQVGYLAVSVQGVPFATIPLQAAEALPPLPPPARPQRWSWVLGLAGLVGVVAWGRGRRRRPRYRLAQSRLWR